MREITRLPSMSGRLNSPRISGPDNEIEVPMFLRMNIGLLIVVNVLLDSCSALVPTGSISQAEWGGTPVATDSGQTIQYITIHHSGVVFEQGKDPKAYLQNLQKWSRAEKTWIDLPYHYILDLDGNIYDGRNPGLPGDTNTSYDVNHHLIICVLGNYEEQIMSNSQMESLVKFTAKKARKYAVPPENIRTHKDWVPTETVCPGRDIQRLFDSGEFHRMVSDRLKSKN